MNVGEMGVQSGKTGGLLAPIVFQSWRPGPVSCNVHNALWAPQGLLPPSAGRPRLERSPVGRRGWLSPTL